MYIPSIFYYHFFIFFVIEIGTATSKLGRGRDEGEMTENVLIRLAFHDCIPYLDGGEQDR